jgi:hypothetical protein
MLSLKLKTDNEALDHAPSSGSLHIFVRTMPQFTAIDQINERVSLEFCRGRSGCKIHAPSKQQNNLNQSSRRFSATNFFSHGLQTSGKSHSFWIEFGFWPRLLG